MCQTSFTSSDKPHKQLQPKSCVCSLKMELVTKDGKALMIYLQGIFGPKAEERWQFMPHQHAVNQFWFKDTFSMALKTIYFQTIVCLIPSDNTFRFI